MGTGRDVRIRCFALIICVSVPALAQTAAVGLFSTNGGPQFSLRTDPPSSGLERRFSSGGSFGSIPDGPQFISRIVVDNTNRVYFGYELLLEEQQPGTYLATFGKLNASLLEVLSILPPGSNSLPQRTGNRTEWTMQPPSTIPEPRVVHVGDTINMVLFGDAATGERLIDDIHILAPQSIFSNLNPPPPAANRLLSTISGTPRNFSAADAELQLVQPRVTLNGIPQSTAGRAGPNAGGLLVWFYLPNHGRYVLSLTPRPDLEFKLAGEVRGGAINFTLGGDSFKLECPAPVASGNAPYNLYVLHDPQWEPTAQSQKGQFATGSVDPGELAALNRK
jgi:hypothetical protein